MSWHVGASTALFVLGIHLACWACWTYRGLPSLLVNPEGYRRVRHTSEGRMLLALLCVTPGLALLGQWLGVGVTGFATAVLVWGWVSSHPTRYARDRPPGGNG